MAKKKNDGTARRDSAQTNNESAGPLVKGKDFYIENGNYVFTEAYLKSRGYCCSNGCRHCPW